MKIGDIQFDDFPFFLAPMEDVSDPPFRALCKEYGCDMMFTEFISVEGLIRDAAKSVQKLDIYPGERPIGIQIFGAQLDSMRKAAEIVEEAGPDVLDINYGCPVKKVVCKMAGAGILQDIPRMVSLTKAIVDSTQLPVTVKTRLGWDQQSIRIVEVAERLQDVGIRALAIHGRTRKQMYKGEADWSYIREVVENPRIQIPIIGNGDVDSPEKALEYKNRYGVDGIMIGRASIGNPWIFRRIKHFMRTGESLPDPGIEERVDVAKRHFRHGLKWKGEKLGILEMRRHYTNYFRGLPQIKQYRNKLVTADHAKEVIDLLDEIRTVYSGRYAFATS